MGLGTSRAMQAAWCCSAAKLSVLRQVPWEHRVNRVTSATWCFQGGAGGALTHSIVLNPDQDMYALMFEIFFKAVRTGDTTDLLCPYHSAAGTYHASQWITQASLTLAPFLARGIQVPDWQGEAFALLCILHVRTRQNGG